jgi:superfamily II DNA or RNA helicase
LAGRVRGGIPYELTPDQAVAIREIKKDMEVATPMDRLLCGDVGYGKTEVAMRAAFKAVMDGKQVAVLAPTTVLAFQHLQTLRESICRLPRRHRNGEQVSHAPGNQSNSSTALRRARSTSLSALTVSSRRTVVFKGPRTPRRGRGSSGLASRTKNASSRCASASMC